MSKGYSFCPPNLDPSPEKDRKALCMVVITEAALQGTALRRRAAAGKKPIMHPGDLGLGKGGHI